MKPLSRSLLCASLLATLPSISVAADDTWLLKGQADAGMVKTLKSGPSDDAAVVPVCCGLFRGCFWRHRALCCCEPICCNPCVVSLLPASWTGRLRLCGPRVRRAAKLFLRGPDLLSPDRVPILFPRAARAVVTLPRLGLSFTLGSGDSFLASRSSIGNRLSGSMRPAEEQRALPPADNRPDQFRYDGGPSAPIPLPGTRMQPLPAEPTTAPALNNRVKSTPRKPTWLAYGERPAQAPSSASRTLLVNGGGR